MLVPYDDNPVTAADGTAALERAAGTLAGPYPPRDLVGSTPHAHDAPAAR